MTRSLTQELRFVTAYANFITLINKDKEFKEMNLEGALCFVVDRVLKTRFIMLFSLQNYSLLMYNELYVNFSKSFIKLNDYFYSYPTDTFVVGI